MRRYQESPEGQAAHARASRKWLDANPEKRAAQVAVSNALRRGKLVKGPCAHGPDGCKGRIEAHHADYTKPLEVTWLCSHHHAQLRKRYAHEEAANS